MSKKRSKRWDNFFGPDPLAGRVNTLNVVPYPKSLYLGPISTQNVVTTFQEARALTAKWGSSKHLELSDLERYMKEKQSPAKLSKKLSLDEMTMEKKKKLSGALSYSTGKLNQYCSFCEANREGFAVFSTHTTSNCLILQNYVCPICGSQGHTISHCKHNTSGSSVVTNMRRADEIARAYDGNFPPLKP